MIISLPKHLPAAGLLRDEGHMVVDHDDPVLAMLKPLRIALVNLMPNKGVTEFHFARHLVRAPHAVHVTLARPAGHTSRNTPERHLDCFYRTVPEILEQGFDGLIVTGAPVEHLAFEAVDYWDEMQMLFDWADRRVRRSLFICWSAQAALYHRHAIAKSALRAKAFGVYEQTILRPDRPVLRGLGGRMPTPVSRPTETRERDVADRAGLDILAASRASGLCLVEEPARGALMMFNHPEYDTLSLDGEYRRDIAAGRDTAVPAHYYPSGDPKRIPANRWAPAAQRFFSNWVVDLARSEPDRAAPAWPMAAAG